MSKKEKFNQASFTLLMKMSIDELEILMKTAEKEGDEVLKDQLSRLMHHKKNVDEFINKFGLKNK